MSNLLSKRDLEERLGSVGQVVVFRSVRTPYKNMNIYVPGRFSPRIASFLALQHVMTNVLGRKSYMGTTIRSLCTHGSKIYAIDKSVIKGSVTECDINGNYTFIPKNVMVDTGEYTFSEAHVARTTLLDIVKYVQVKHVSGRGIQPNNLDYIELDIILPVPHTRFFETDSCIELTDDAIGRGYKRLYGRITSKLCVQLDGNSVHLNEVEGTTSMTADILSDGFLRGIITHYIIESFHDRVNPVSLHEVSKDGNIPIFEGQTSFTKNPNMGYPYV